jgi:hypothetical protein
LRVLDDSGDYALSLAGVAATGFFDAEAVSGKSLVKTELLGDRIQATYAASNRGGLEVRASWSPTPRRDGIDLEVQVSASSVGQLKSLETYVSSGIGGPVDALGMQPAISVQPRDSKAAALSYDGRMSLADLCALTTLPLCESDRAYPMRLVAQGPGGGSDRRYLELAHPHDVARRIVWAPQPLASGNDSPLQIQYGLFGHDLEKGVVIRARMRGLWVRSDVAAAVPRRVVADFLEAPPPLGP